MAAEVSKRSTLALPGLGYFSKQFRTSWYSPVGRLLVG